MQNDDPYNEPPQPPAPEQKAIYFSPPLPDLEAPDGPKVGVGDDSPEHKNPLTSFTPVLAILIIAPLIAISIIKFGFQSYVVDGASMDPTLHDQEFLIISKTPRTVARITGNDYIPERGDIVVFNDKIARQYIGGEEAQFIKRVIGLPGDRVQVKEGVVIIYNSDNPDGYRPDLNPSYSSSIDYTPGNIDITVGEGQIFVCGDNRNNSLDSRAFGPISTKDIVGKLTLRLSPLNKIERF